MEYFNTCYKVSPAKGTKNNSLQSYKKVSETSNLKNKSIESILKSSNVGIITGKVNNLLVVDLDSQKSNFNFPFDLDELTKKTYSQKTPSGGYHLFYQYDKDIKQSQNESINVDTRSDGGFIIFSGSTFQGKKYEALNDLYPSKIPSEIKEFLLNNGFDKKEKQESKKKMLSNINSDMGKQDKNIYIPYNHLKEILDNKPDDFINGYENFFKFTSCMRYLNHYDLWDEYSITKPKYDKNKNIEIWNKCDPNKCNLNFLVDLYKNKENQGYYQLKHLPQFTLESTKINKQKLGYDFIESNKNYIIKSDTGTGKTTSVKHFLNKSKNNFISIVSRVSLGQEQFFNFNQDNFLECDFYQSKNFFENEDNIIIQIDSLLKIHNNIDISEYVIVLDEFESILDHLFTSSTLTNRRVLIMIKFIQMLKQCKNFICIDADITNKSIEFIKKFINRKYNLYENDYKHNKGINAYEIEDENDFIHKLKKQNKFLCCCDSKREAERFKNLLNDDDVILITGDTDEYYNFDEHQKIIYSPKIIYGIDSTMSRNVFCWYKEHTINTKKMVQQIARCRNINNLYYHFEKKDFKYSDITYNQVLEENKKILDYGMYNENKTLETTFKLVDPDLEKQYLKLFSKFEYEEICYNTNKHAHFIKLLEQRGFILSNEQVKKNFHIIKEPKVDIEFTEEDFNKFFNITNNKKILEILGLCKNDQVIKDNFDLIKSYTFVSSYLACKYFFFENRTDKDLLENVSNQDEFIVNKVSCSKQKLRLLMHFKELVNDRNIYEINSNKLLSQEQINKFQYDYKLTFNKKYQDLKFKFDKPNNLNKIQAQMYKDIFGRDFVSSSKKQINNDRCQIYEINQDVFNKYKSLYDAKTEKIEEKKEFYKEMAKELDRGIFID